VFNIDAPANKQLWQITRKSVLSPKSDTGAKASDQQNDSHAENAIQKD
jgi:hypothetical protein